MVTKTFFPLLLLLITSAGDVLADVRLCRYTRGRDKDKVVNVELPGRCPGGSEQVLYQRQYYGGGGTDLTVAPDATVTLDTNYFEYRNCTIGAGATFYMFSGTILKCNGSFENNGTIEIVSRATGGTRGLMFANGLIQMTSNPPYPGLHGGMPQEGGYIMSSTEPAFGGSFTNGRLPVWGAQPYLYPGLLGGSGGAAGATLGSSPAGSGGGTLAILAKRRITNSGRIAADGVNSSASGGGGGGGGFITLVSAAGIVNNTGTISVRGGNGGAAAIDQTNHFAVGGGGGGGGGHVTLIAPAVSVGAVVATGGTGGAGIETGAGVETIHRFGGGTGGPGSTNGGEGGGCGTSSIGAGQNGLSGGVDTIQKDPMLVY